MSLGDLRHRQHVRDRQRERAVVDQRDDVVERVPGAIGAAAGEANALLLRAREVGDRDDVVRSAGELDERRDAAAQRDVDRAVDTAGRERRTCCAISSP